MQTLTLSALCALLLAQSAAALAADPACRARTDVVGGCFAVRGTLQLYNGTPSARIRAAGQRRTFGVVPYFDQGDETFAAPAAVRQRASFDKPVAGLYTVCPLEKARQGQMQSVCIDRAVFLKPRHR